MLSQKKIHITLPDGAVRTLPFGTTGAILVKSIHQSLAKKTLAMEVNGVVWDLARALVTDATVRFLTWEENEGKQVFWHSTSHLLAEALTALYPGIQLGIGPPIENGFYYDVDFGNLAFNSTHLVQIENKMRELLKEKATFYRIELTKEEALSHFTTHDNPYKRELISELKAGSITFYRQGTFTDLCKGPHLPHTGYINAIKLLNVAGAYWRGNVAQKQLTRLYGISFPKQHLLEEYLVLKEEAKKRDHRRLGKELGFFTFSDNVGPGLPLWLPKGTFLREKLVDFLKKNQEKAGYMPVVTPHIGHKRLYVTSGHYEKYKENTFKAIETPQEGEAFLLKPMNCPHHCAIYQATPHSYQELPIRLAEFGTVYRYEQSGELHGLIRVRGFTQDDAHIFCTPSQVKEEVMHVVDLVHEVLAKFDFQSYEVQISLRDPANLSKYIGSDALWESAEKALQDIIKQKGLVAKVALGEAAFYGPKLDFMVRDALSRRWQLGTVQVDYQLPERFNLTYVGKDNKKHRPVMIHRAPFGSLERFIAILLEHTGGKLPLWLCPEQVVVLPISASYVSYAQNVVDKLCVEDIRARLDARDEKVGRKIRDAELAKIPYMLLLGEKEITTNKVAIRKQGHGMQKAVPLENFIASFKEEVL